MVRLLKNDNIELITNLICTFFNMQRHMTNIVNVNYPKITPCIFAMWHSKQFCLFGLENKAKTNVMISRSKDGKVIADSINKVFGFKSVRGSKGRQGAVEATMQMIDLLKSGEECAIMVDGPKGPAKIVKNGVIKIAKLSGAPIVPVCWYSPYPNLFKFNTWDKFEAPLGPINLINLYGNPIYVKNEDDENTALSKLQQELENLDNVASEEFNKVYRFGLWQKK